MNDDSPPLAFQKGFNDGYLLAKHMPDLAENLLKASGSSPFLDALKMGIEQYSIEKGKQPSFPWLSKDRLSKLSNKTDKSKDKDDLEK